MEIFGYKAFTHPMQTYYGRTLEVGKIYKTEGEITFGTQSRHGIHFCKNFEDTFYYFKGLEIDLCSVIGRGKIVETTSESDIYNGREGIYAASELEIVENLNHEAIMKLADELTTLWPPMRFITFLKFYKLSLEEAEYFRTKFNSKFGWNSDILDTINYNQYDEQAVKKLVYKKN